MNPFSDLPEVGFLCISHPRVVITMQESRLHRITCRDGPSSIGNGLIPASISPSDGTGLSVRLFADFYRAYLKRDGLIKVQREYRPMASPA